MTTMTAETSPLLDRVQDRFSFPVLMKEMRVRMRGLRAPALLFVCTTLAIIVGLMIILPSWGEIATGGMDIRWSMVRIGKSLFVGMIILEAILCALIAPSLTAGAVSIEREQQTLDLLLLTRLSNVNILLGKLISSLSFIFIILICSLPVVAISFLLGGVDPGQLLWSAALIFAVAILFSAIGLYCSVHFKRTATAVAVTFAAAVLWMVFMPILLAMIGAFMDASPSPARACFVSGVAAAFAFFPTLAFSAILNSIFRRPLPVWVAIGYWLLFTVAGFIVLDTFAKEFYSAANSQHIFYLIGNPFWAMMRIIESVVNPTGSPMSWLEGHAIQLTAGAQLVAAWVMMALAGGEMRKMRG